VLNNISPVIQENTGLKNEGAVVGGGGENAELFIESCVLSTTGVMQRMKRRNDIIGLQGAV